MYPSSIRPTPHKKRKGKESYCQRLAHNLERFDKNPNIWLNSWSNSTPHPILRLPPELRQSIIFECISDENLYTPRPNLETQTLSLVCKTFARDVQAAKTMWDGREQELRRLYGFEKVAFSNYISDLMGPISDASAALSLRMKAKNTNQNGGPIVRSKKVEQWLIKRKAGKAAKRHHRT